MLTTAAITLVAGAVCLLVTAAFIFRDRIAQYYFALRSSSIPWIVGATVRNARHIGSFAAVRFTSQRFISSIAVQVIFYYSVSGCAYNIATQAVSLILLLRGRVSHFERSREVAAATV